MAIKPLSPNMNILFFFTYTVSLARAQFQITSDLG